MAAISPRDVLATERAEIGHNEKPVNDVKYNTAYYGHRVSGPQWAWCGSFQWWAFLQRGIDLRKHGISNPASTNAFDADARRAGWKVIAKERAQLGDIVFYDFGDLGAGDTANDDDHMGMCSRSAPGGYLHAIEGNTSPGNGGSQANGGGVYERQRSLSLVRHVLRPPYEAWSLELASAGKAKEDDMYDADTERPWLDQRLEARLQPTQDALAAQAAQITALQQQVAKLQPGAAVNVDALAAAVAAKLGASLAGQVADALSARLKA